MSMNANPFHALETYFPRSAIYRQVPHIVALYEQAGPFRHFPYRERHLQCLWADQRLRPTNLITTDGERVDVEHAGNWNLEAGPDFLNAVLRIGNGRRLCGDLEVHIHPNGWQQHGHAGDPRYENVRFHLVYFPGPEIDGLIQIPLQDVLTANPRFSFENIDLTAYPYSVPTGDFPLRDLDPDHKTAWLEAAGEERLRLKAERYAFAMHSRDPEQLLWEELLAALGYKNNKSPFRRLAAALPLARLRAIAPTPETAYALLLGLSGLLPTDTAQPREKETRAFIRKIWDCWWKQSGNLTESPLLRSDWNLSGIRPANHPVRRLMAAAHYAFRIPEIATNPQLLSDFPINFWSVRLNWNTRCKPMTLVGPARANAMVTNILVPWNAATGATEPKLDRLPPEPGNSIIRQTAHALFGPDHTCKTYRSTLARQGLIQIFHDYLIPHQLDQLRTIVACPAYSAIPS